MTWRRRDLMAKAKGFTASIARMPEAQRQQNPRGDVGNDYNLLHARTAEAFPSIAELLPPRVEVERTDYGHHYAAITFSELDTYCEQIYQLLAEQDEQDDS